MLTTLLGQISNGVELTVPLNEGEDDPTGGATLIKSEDFLDVFVELQHRSTLVFPKHLSPRRAQERLTEQPGSFAINNRKYSMFSSSPSSEPTYSSRC